LNIYCTKFSGQCQKESSSVTALDPPAISESTAAIEKNCDTITLERFLSQNAVGNIMAVLYLVSLGDSAQIGFVLFV
jgi:hypothetical protein